MATIKEICEAAVTGMADSRVSMTHVPVVEEKDKIKTFVADHFIVAAGGFQLAKVIDPGTWPVTIEHQHANPKLVTNHPAHTLTALRALLPALLGDDESKTILARVPKPPA